MSGPASFPTNYPPSCPPLDAADADIIVYRTVANDPPQQSDLLSWVEEGKTKPKKKPKCDEHSVSVLRSRDDAIHHRELFGWAGQFIAEGKLIRDHGKTKDSPAKNFPSHVDWWPYEGVERFKAFEVVKGL